MKLLRECDFKCINFRNPNLIRVTRTCELGLFWDANFGNVNRISKIDCDKIYFTYNTNKSNLKQQQLSLVLCNSRNETSSGRRTRNENRGEPTELEIAIFEQRQLLCILYFIAGHRNLTSQLQKIVKQLQLSIKNKINCLNAVSIRYSECFL